MARIRYGAWLIAAAFALLGVVFGVAVSQFSTASDVTAVVGSVTTVVGTIIGAFFGVQAGAAGKEAAEAGRAKAEAGRAQAENAAAYLAKGSRVNVIGRLQNDNYTDAQGATVHGLTFTCEEIDYLDSKAEAKGRPSGNGPFGQGVAPVPPTVEPVQPQRAVNSER